jgi:TPR repeat protein
MAATYDPAELDRLGIEVQGAIADPAQARKWYERARALGAPEAEERLARIGAR